jgi:hypothetical protein
MFLDYSKINIIKLSKSMIKTHIILSDLLKNKHKIESTNIPIEIQRMLISNNDDYTAIRLARNKKVHKDIQIILANYDDVNVRSVLALNPKIDNNIQLILADDKDFRVKRSLAQNENLSIEAQEILVKNIPQDIMIGYYLRQNSNVDTEIKSRIN